MMGLDWSHVSAIIGTAASTIAVMKTFGRGAEWVGKRFSRSVALEIRAQLRHVLASPEQTEMIRGQLEHAFSSPERLTALSDALAQNSRFQSVMRHAVRNAMAGLCGNCPPSNFGV